MAAPRPTPREGSRCGCCRIRSSTTSTCASTTRRPSTRCATPFPPISTSPSRSRAKATCRPIRSSRTTPTGPRSRRWWRSSEPLRTAARSCAAWGFRSGGRPSPSRPAGRTGGITPRDSATSSRGTRSCTSAPSIPSSLRGLRREGACGGPEPRLSQSIRVLPGGLLFSDVLGLVGVKLAEVEAEVARNLHSEIGVIDELGTYLSNGSGKRLRPLLLLLSAQMSGYHGDRDVLFASVFEFIHTATLVHDDVIDGATLRRGRSSLNAAWGNSLTVLLGDYLYIKSMSMALTADDLRIIKILADITLKMIEGELIQKRRQGEIGVTAEEHLDIVRRKTACLFSGCSLVGALLAGIGPEKQEDLRSFGLNLGMAFQLIDDMLDFTSDEKTLGKPVVSDLREGKLTLPLIYLLEAGDSEHRSKVQTVLQDRDFSRVPAEEIVRLVQQGGTLERTRELARQYGEKAKRDLRTFPDSLARSAMETLPDLILARDR